MNVKYELYLTRDEENVKLGVILLPRVEYLEGRNSDLEIENALKLERKRDGVMKTGN